MKKKIVILSLAVLIILVVSLLFFRHCEEADLSAEALAKAEGRRSNPILRLLRSLRSLAMTKGAFGLAMRARAMLIFIQNLFQCFADNCHFILGKIVMERQGDSAFRDGFGNREIALLIAELLNNKRLQMHRRKIVADLNVLTSHRL